MVRLRLSFIATHQRFPLCPPLLYSPRGLNDLADEFTLLLPLSGAVVHCEEFGEAMRMRKVCAAIAVSVVLAREGMSQDILQ